MKRAICLIVALVMVLTLCACAHEPFDIRFQPQERGRLYFYGLAQEDGAYYAKVLPEYKAEPAGEELLYAPLSRNLTATFQLAGVEGTWNPQEYLSARELEVACRLDRVTLGVQISYTAEEGRIITLQEHDPYAPGGVTGG